MVSQKSGKIINILSAPEPSATDPEWMENIPYRINKTAIISFTRDLARKWSQHKIKVNAISSEYINNRLKEAEAIMGALVFLSSSPSDYITGQVLSLDDGSPVYRAYGDD